MPLDPNILASLLSLLQSRPRRLVHDRIEAESAIAIFLPTLHLEGFRSRLLPRHLRFQSTILCCVSFVLLKKRVLRHQLVQVLARLAQTPGSPVGGAAGGFSAVEQVGLWRTGLLGQVVPNPWRGPTCLLPVSTAVRFHHHQVLAGCVASVSFKF